MPMTVRMRRAIVVLAVLLIAALMVVRVAVRSQAVPPGNRGDIAFASDRSGNDDIFTMDPGTGTVTPVIQTAANERAPAWNPDGTKIAFVRENTTACSPLSCWDLYVRDLVASTTTKLTSFGAGTQLFDTTWSTDGTRIAFTKLDTVTTNDIYVVPANGSTGPVQVTATPVAESSPDWSPDSTQLLMSNGGHLFTIASSAVAGTPTQVTLTGAPPAYAKDASWGPDGRFAFVGGATKFLPISIYTANSDGSGAAQVWNAGGGTINSPAWAPDGSRITYAYVASGTNYEIGILRLCSGAVTYPAPNAAIDVDPNWQPVLPAYEHVFNDIYFHVDDQLASAFSSEWTPRLGHRCRIRRRADFDQAGRHGHLGQPRLRSPRRHRREPDVLLEHRTPRRLLIGLEELRCGERLPVRRSGRPHPPRGGDGSVDSDTVDGRTFNHIHGDVGLQTGSCRILLRRPDPAAGEGMAIVEDARDARRRRVPTRQRARNLSVPRPAGQAGGRSRRLVAGGRRPRRLIRR